MTRCCPSTMRTSRRWRSPWRAGLELCGYPRCPGDVMATNPRWRRSLTSWRAEFRAWMAEPGSNEVLHAQIFFDLRSVHGGTVRAESLREAVACTRRPGTQRFLGRLAAQAVERQPPIGFFREFVLEREGEHRATLDLKSGVHTIIELTRVHALAHGVPAVNTIERLRALRALGALAADSETRPRRGLRARHLPAAAPPGGPGEGGARAGQPPLPRRPVRAGAQAPARRVRHHPSDAAGARLQPTRPS